MNRDLANRSEPAGECDPGAGTAGSTEIGRIDAWDPDLGVALRPWSAGDLPLLERLLGDAHEMRHVGGPETPEQLRSRHERYLRAEAPGQVFAITIGSDARDAGWIGFWETEWQGEVVWEAGWNVLPEFQGLGVASAAARLLLERMTQERSHRYVHAFPAVDNVASNAVCRKAAFTCSGEVEVEYPPGHSMLSNDWRFDLSRPKRCPECGAVVPPGGSCLANLHALLALESNVAGAAGALPHFYAVAAYGLQHPASMGFTVETIEGLRESVAAALGGCDDVGHLRARARAAASAQGRVRRRDGERVPVWPDPVWSVTVRDVLAGGVAGYGEHVALWARSVLDATAGLRPTG